MDTCSEQRKREKLRTSVPEKGLLWSSVATNHGNSRGHDLGSDGAGARIILMTTKEFVIR